MVAVSRRYLPNTKQQRTEKNSGRDWRSLPFVSLMVMVCWASPVSGASVTVKDLLAHGERYDQQPVSVIGPANAFKILTGPRNLPFYTFTLRDNFESGDEVTVIMRGKPEVANGDRVYVYGVFFKSRKAGRTTITNRIEATIVEQLHDQRQPLIG